MNWIDIKTEIPDDDRMVIIHVSDSADEPVFFGYHDGDEWRDVFAEVRKVTHWMELPEGPQQ